MFKIYKEIVFFVAIPSQGVTPKNNFLQKRQLRIIT